MLQSMTAYGRAHKQTKTGKYLVEIQAVNRRYLDIQTYLPSELLKYDPVIKKWISAAIRRGQVTLKVTPEYDDVTPIKVKPNLSLALQMKKAVQEIENKLKIEVDSNTLIKLVAREGNLFLFDQELPHETAYLESLYESIHEALEEVIKMKQAEGKNIQNDLEKRLSLLKTFIKKIKEKIPGATDKYQEKLVNKLEEILPGSVDNEERILREISLFVEKIDITEEVIRFQSHLEQLSQVFQIDGAVGKKIEFLLQELNREINTIGSKSSDVEVSRLVIETKAELEKIREQIQNIE